MARVINNLLTRGLSGAVGGLVFRQVQEQTIVSAAPNKTAAPASPRQQAHRRRFFEAQCYATGQMQDPAAKALYATGIDARRTSARVVAIADFMNPPAVVAADLAGYHGRPGDIISAWATDDFAVTALTVRLVSAAGVLLEEGPATLLPDGSWRYTLGQPHPASAGTQVHLTAFDRPGNAGSRTYLL
ncbi:hypothetical protein EJV47_07125 [Hymenobacter gummosus]|uniref:Uncharacterized protein n=1 Tax=Hymenobacter gummosus TaxID=1776032 RepID=A0A3S0H8C4_9BACT|nr:hypothetical protein [Hymenobacter gummosus]RTQ51564.1 hypothetical protein EJV47_07125 [Hymenobacter gummosus]